MKFLVGCRDGSEMGAPALSTEEEYSSVLKHDSQLQSMGLHVPDRIPLRQFIRAISLEEETLP